jgi:hypothetical protein
MREELKTYLQNNNGDRNEICKTSRKDARAMPPFF